MLAIANALSRLTPIFCCFGSPGFPASLCTLLLLVSQESPGIAGRDIQHVRSTHSVQITFRAHGSCDLWYTTPISESAQTLGNKDSLTPVFDTVAYVAAFVYNSPVSAHREEESDVFRVIYFAREQYLTQGD